jgi:hypothetical protein
LRKLRSDYPGWNVRMDLETMVGNMIEMEEHKRRKS